MHRILLKSTKREFIQRLNGTEFVHASTNLHLDEDTMLLAWFSGSVEGNDDVAIYFSRKSAGYWSEPQKLEDHINLPHWNPVLFSLDANRQILFYKIGQKITEWQTYFCITEDKGKTFSTPRELVKGEVGGRGPVRNKPIRISNGDIVAPASRENGIWHAFVDISSDLGNTWEASTEIVVENLIFDEKKVVITDSLKKIPVSEQSYFGRGVIQPTIWESQGGAIHMLLRSTEGAIYRSDSTDYGRTWSYAYKTELPNNNSGIDLVKTKEGTLFLVYNPVGENWGKRSPISLSYSTDNGQTWETLMTFDSGEGEFSYPAITCSANKLFVSYSFKRESIVFWEIEFEEVNSKPQSL